MMVLKLTGASGLVSANTSVLNEDGRSIVGFVSALVLMK
jgi:hypothetical protein